MDTGRTTATTRGGWQRQLVGEVAETGLERGLMRGGRGAGTTCAEGQCLATRSACASCQSQGEQWPGHPWRRVRNGCEARLGGSWQDKPPLPASSTRGRIAGPLVPRWQVGERQCHTLSARDTFSRKTAALAPFLLPSPASTRSLLHSPLMRLCRGVASQHATYASLDCDPRSSPAASRLATIVLVAFPKGV